MPFYTELVYHLIGPGIVELIRRDGILPFGREGDMLYGTPTRKGRDLG